MAESDKPGDLLATALENLGRDASAASRDRLKARLEALAAELALEWLTGEARFENQTQQAEAWLARFYEEIFIDEQPDAATLYARFGFSLPRAQYIARLLAARRQASWRIAARNEFIAVLRQSEAKAREMVGRERGDTQHFDLSLSKVGYDELLVCYEAAIAGLVSKPGPPRRLSSTPKFIWFNIPADTLVLVLDSVKGAA